MTSQIDVTTIEEMYPVARVNNDSQPFRTNFQAIKANLNKAADEITAIHTWQSTVINDTVPTTATVWSASKTSSAISGLLADSTTSTSYTWSSTKILSQINQLISDSTTSAGSTWSSTKINSTVTGLINDSVIVSNKTWSSDKIANSMSDLIADSVIAVNKTWSSDKIVSSLSLLIDDAATSTTKTWSSDKIANEASSYLTKTNYYTKNNTVRPVELTVSGNVILDGSASNTFHLTVAGDTYISNIAPAVNGSSIFLVLIQDASGSRTVTFGPTFRWSLGVAPEFSTEANGIDIVSMHYCQAASCWLCVMQPDFLTPI